jgi:hypothetical protein
MRVSQPLLHLRMTTDHDQNKVMPGERERDLSHYDGDGLVRCAALAVV